MDEPAWKRLKLSVEPPYKDEDGRKILRVYDIEKGNVRILEEKKSASTRLRDVLARIALERGPDIASLTIHNLKDDDDERKEPENAVAKDADDEEEQAPMEYDELAKMRETAFQNLEVAAGEISQALEVLNLLLPSGSQTAATISTTLLTNSRPPPKPSVQSLNALMATGTKSTSLKSASDIFSEGAQRLGTEVVRSEDYWKSALKLRTGNWGLIAMPVDERERRGKDALARDFLISYGLEQSPLYLRQQALATLTPDPTISSPLSFRRRQLRLQIHIIRDGVKSSNLIRRIPPDSADLNERLKEAQRAIVEEEIFHQLVKETGNLPSMAALVAERKIDIEVCENLNLTFELFDPSSIDDPSKETPTALPSLILSTLLLLRTTPSPHLPKLLSTLQYVSFLSTLYQTLQNVVKNCKGCTLRWTSVGESVDGILKAFLTVGAGGGEVGGEAVLTIYDRHVVRLTFTSPTTLTIHVLQATLPITDMPQLRRMLRTEVGRCALETLVDVGKKDSPNDDGNWFVDRVEEVGVGLKKGRKIRITILWSDRSESFLLLCLVTIGAHRFTYSSSSSTEERPTLIEWFRSTLLSVE